MEEKKEIDLFELRDLVLDEALKNETSESLTEFVEARGVMIKELEEVFEGRGEVRGFTFTQLDRSDYAYLYEQKEKISGHITYEVFRRKVNTQFGCVSYPSSKGFGDSVFMGKTFRNLNKAKEYFAYLNKLAEEKSCV